MHPSSQRLRRAGAAAIASLSAALTLACAQVSAASPPPGSYITIPDGIGAQGRRVDVERGLLFVPENRRPDNRQPRESRTIAVHFLRFAALEKGSSRPPVFMLAGGPGSDLDFGRAPLMDLVERLRRHRDVVYLSQRGYPASPGLVPDLRVNAGPAPLDVPGTPVTRAEREAAAWKKAIAEWSAKGVDLSGYDILNIVDDVHDLRAALGYDKIILRACSFGSQWSFAYMKRWPQTVDRAFLGGIEPLDYGYDSPKWLWASLMRLAKLAEADVHLAPHVPAGGLAKAIDRLIAQLERAPAKVSIVVDTADPRPLDVVVGADDLRRQLRDADGFMGRTRLDSLASWPRFIIELTRGDYRYLAATTWQRRVAGEARPMILALIDNSLGISAARDAKIAAEPEARWIGDVNEYYRATRSLTPTPDAGDAFRADWPLDIPILMVNGDLDWATPLENALHEKRFAARGHLLTVQGGTHCSEFWELPGQRPEVNAMLYDFVDAEDPQQALQNIPEHVALAPMVFHLPAGASLYDQWLARRSGPGVRP